MRVLTLWCIAASFTAAKAERVPIILWAHGTAGAMTLPMLEKNDMTLESLGALLANDVAPMAGNLNTTAWWYAAKATQNSISVGGNYARGVPRIVRDHALSKTLGAQAFEQSIQRLKRLLDRQPTEPDDIVNATILTLQLRQYDNEAFLEAFGTHQLPAMSDTAAKCRSLYASKMLKTLVRGYTEQDKALIRSALEMADRLNLEFDAAADERSIRELLNLIQPDRQDISLVRNITDQIKIQMGNSAATFTSALMGHFQTGAKFTSDTQNLFDAAIDLMAQEVHEAIAQFHRVFAPGFTPHVTLTEKDKIFMRTPLPLVLASTRASLAGWTQMDHPLELMCPVSLKVGREIDVLATEAKFCGRLRRWVKRHGLIKSVKVMFYDKRGALKHCTDRNIIEILWHWFKYMII